MCKEDIIPDEKFNTLINSTQTFCLEAMCDMGIYRVICGYKKSDKAYYDEGFKMLEEAVLKGSGEAAAFLGCVHQEGKYGIPCDMVKAVEYYKSGAESGNTQCMSNYAVALQRGHGNLKQDDVEAFKWLKKAADSDSENGVAHYNVALAYHAGRGVRIDRQQAKLYFQNAAKCGIGMAEMWLYSEDYKNMK